VLSLGSAQCSKKIADGLNEYGSFAQQKKEKKVMGNMNKTMSPTNLSRQH
jgi:hypothetical protein